MTDTSPMDHLAFLGRDTLLRAGCPSCNITYSIKALKGRGKEVNVILPGVVKLVVVVTVPRDLVKWLAGLVPTSTKSSAAVLHVSSPAQSTSTSSGNLTSESDEDGGRRRSRETTAGQVGHRRR